MVKFLRFLSLTPAAAARTERVGKLRDREDTLAV